MEIQKSVKACFAIASLLLAISVVGLVAAKRIEIEAFDPPPVQRVSEKELKVEPRPVPIYRIGE